jgi:tRNA nucleotidyltransferase/poly(A) polymerase
MSEGLQVARTALAGTEAWLVGGAIRDRILGRSSPDLDVVVAGDPADAARAVAAAARATACFPLSEDYGSWRVLARDGSWQIDVEPLRAPTLAGDLALRDFTINAIAEPLAGGGPLDPLGGIADLERRTLRMAGPGAFGEDPLRALRLARLAVELELTVEDRTAAAASAVAADLAGVAGERVFAELRRILASPRARHGAELLDRLGLAEVVLPELIATKDVEQSRYHHLDVYGHTLEVLDRAVELTDALAGEGELPGELERTIGPHRDELALLLDEPLADGLTRGQALRWGALLHDAAKPLTREVRGGDGRVTFIGHDSRGAELAVEVLGRLRASVRLSSHVAALVRNHLRLGFLVHEPQPLSRRAAFSYLRGCSPVEVDVTLLSIVDRMATRGAASQEAIDSHLALAADMLGRALRWRAEGPPRPLLRGDELAARLGVEPGPRLGRLLEALLEEQYAGEIATAEEALVAARELMQNI